VCARREDKRTNDAFHAEQPAQGRDHFSSLTYEIDAGRGIYLVPAVGQILVNAARVGDGLAVTNDARLKLTALHDSEVVVVELART
jgi:hypothetical protein